MNPLPNTDRDAAASTEPFLVICQGLFRRRIRFPSAYAAVLALSTLDVCFTAAILHLGGDELNAVADWVLRQFGLPGMAIFKFLLIGLAIVICEAVALREPALASNLSFWTATISLFPVVVGALCLAEYYFAGAENLRHLTAAAELKAAGVT